jgi:hypothetical protein
MGMRLPIFLAPRMELNFQVSFSAVRDLWREWELGRDEREVCLSDSRIDSFSKGGSECVDIKRRVELLYSVRAVDHAKRTLKISKKTRQVANDGGGAVKEPTDELAELTPRP